jgi:type II secretory pathway component PulF
MMSAAVILSERLEPSLIVALALIVGGIALGTVGDIRAARTTVPAKL